MSIRNRSQEGVHRKIRTLAAILCLTAAWSASADHVPRATLLVPYFANLHGTSFFVAEAEDPPGCVAELFRGGGSPLSCAYRVETLGQGQKLGQAVMVEECQVDGTSAQHSAGAGFTLYKVGCSVELTAADGSKIIGRSVGDLLVLEEGRGQQTSSFIQLGGTGRFSSEIMGGGFGQRILVPDADPAQPTGNVSSCTFYDRYVFAEPRRRGAR